MYSATPCCPEVHLAAPMQRVEAELESLATSQQQDSKDIQELKEDIQAIKDDLNTLLSKGGAQYLVIALP